jgi:hypothetical protein
MVFEIINTKAMQDGKNIKKIIELKHKKKHNSLVKLISMFSFFFSFYHLTFLTHSLNL